MKSAGTYEEILTAVYDAGRVTRSELCRLTGLGRMTVSRLVERLLDIGALRETVRPAGTRRLPTGSLSVAFADPVGVIDLSRRDPAAYLLSPDGRILQKTYVFYVDSLQFEDNLYLLENRILNSMPDVFLYGTALILPCHGTRIIPCLSVDYPPDDEIAARVKADLSPKDLIPLSLSQACLSFPEKDTPELYLHAYDSLYVHLCVGNRILPLKTDALPLNGRDETFGVETLGRLFDTGRFIGTEEAVTDSVGAFVKTVQDLYPNLVVTLDTDRQDLRDACSLSGPDASGNGENDLPSYLRGALRSMMIRRFRIFSEKAAKPIDFHDRL